MKKIDIAVPECIRENDSIEAGRICRIVLDIVVECQDNFSAKSPECNYAFIAWSACSTADWRTKSFLGMYVSVIIRK